MDLFDLGCIFSQAEKAEDEARCTVFMLKDKINILLADTSPEEIAEVFLSKRTLEGVTSYDPPEKFAESMRIIAPLIFQKKHYFGQEVIEAIKNYKVEIEDNRDGFETKHFEEIRREILNILNCQKTKTEKEEINEQRKASKTRL